MTHYLLIDIDKSCNIVLLLLLGKDFDFILFFLVFQIKKLRKNVILNLLLIKLKMVIRKYLISMMKLYL